MIKGPFHVRKQAVQLLFFLKSSAEIFFNVFNNRNDIVSVYNSSGSWVFFFAQQTNGKTSGLSNFSSYADRLIGGYATQSKARVIRWIFVKAALLLLASREEMRQKNKADVWKTPQLESRMRRNVAEKFLSCCIGVWICEGFSFLCQPFH